MYEFRLSKGRNGKRSRRHKKFERQRMNRFEGVHMSMGRAGYSKELLYGGFRRGFTSYSHIRKFLLRRVGRPIDKVFSELAEALGSCDCNPLREIDEHLYYERMRSKGDCSIREGFYITNGILNYKEEDRKMPLFSKEHLEWNKTHIDWDTLMVLTVNASMYGPLLVGKLWVEAGGAVMLLPVYVIHSVKWNARDKDVNPRLRGLFGRESLTYLGSFTNCIVGGKDLGGFYQTFNKWGGVDTTTFFIVRKRDIELYRKQKFKE